MIYFNVVHQQRCKALLIADNYFYKQINFTRTVTFINKIISNFETFNLGHNTRQAYNKQSLGHNKQINFTM